MSKPYSAYNRKRINFDDDIVLVFKDGSEIYKGEEDYEPMKDENWVWDNLIHAYRLTDPRTKNNEYIKICLDI